MSESCVWVQLSASNEGDQRSRRTAVRHVLPRLGWEEVAWFLHGFVLGFQASLSLGSLWQVVANSSYTFLHLSTPLALNSQRFVSYISVLCSLRKCLFCLLFPNIITFST